MLGIYVVYFMWRDVSSYMIINLVVVINRYVDRSVIRHRYTIIALYTIMFSVNV